MTRVIPYYAKGSSCLSFSGKVMDLLIERFDSSISHFYLKFGRCSILGLHSRDQSAVLVYKRKGKRISRLA